MTSWNREVHGMVKGTTAKREMNPALYEEQEKYREFGVAA